MNKNLFDEIRERSKEFFKHSFHSKIHVERVYKLATKLAKEENADLEIVKVAALLHDVARAMEDDGKIKDHAVESAKIAGKILRDINFPEEKIDKVVHCIEVHRFRKGVKAESLEAKILQDADRLDIVGAIGIARVFACGGWLNVPIYDPSISPKEQYDGKSLTSVNLIYEKILRVKDTLNTVVAKEIVEGRHKFVEQFLERFLREWEVEI